MKYLLRVLGSTTLVTLLAFGASADTIYMKNGSVIRGSVVGYANGAFTVLLTSGPSGARSRATLAGDEIDRIEFEEENGGSAAAPAANDSGSAAPTWNPAPAPSGREDAYRAPSPAESTVADPAAGRASRTGDVQVQANTDWINSQVLVRPGDRVSISATGTIKLDSTGRRVAGPSGIDVPDRDKLIPRKPTGALIAVIGDDNDDFIYVGSQVEFTAQRAGYLFLSVNEGVLGDNSGAFDASVELNPTGTVASNRAPDPVSPTRRPTPRNTSPEPERRAKPVPPRRSDPVPTAPAPSTADDESLPDDTSDDTSMPDDTPAPEPASRPNVDPAPASGASTVVLREADVDVQAALDWTNTKIRVQRGNRIRIAGSGSVKLDRAGRTVSGPSGISVADNDRLMPNYPTGSLIAVIGDDNDEFIFVGQTAEFIAQRSGILFLSINEGNLRDNTGVFQARIVVEQGEPMAANTLPATTPANRPAAQPAPTGNNSGGLPKPVVDDSLGGAEPAKPLPTIGPEGGQTQVIVSAKADWTSTRVVLKKGSKVRITASGKVTLDAAGKVSATPSGVDRPDPLKLLQDKPTGALVAVIGDDGTEYIYVGTQIEFTATRDGLLFLGINEGELFDNSGSYTVNITVTPARKGR